eukprot:gene6480-biopygen8274
MSQARTVIASGVKGLMFGGMMYLTGDTVSDLLVYSKLHSQAMHLVLHDSQLADTIGQPYQSGPWYNATLAFSHRDKVAHCTFQVKGSRSVTDIAVKAGRRAGYSSNILYNLFGPGTWELLSCQAMMPSEGGLVQARSLMPEHQQDQQVLQHGAQPATSTACNGSSSSTQPCQVPQAQHQSCVPPSAGLPALQQGEQAGRSARSWWPWRRGNQADTNTSRG